MDRLRLRLRLSRFAQRARKPLPYLVLTFSICTTLGTWYILDAGYRAGAHAVYERKVAAIESTFLAHLRHHEQALLGGVGLFNAKGFVTQDDWRRYVSSLGLREHHPGILGLGYVAWMTQPQMAVVLYLEPVNWRNERAFGYDILAESKRRSAMMIARDSGRTSLAANVTLVQEAEEHHQRGFLIYAPVYRRGMPVESVEQRRAAIQGFVYSPVRTKDFIRATLDDLPDDIAFDVYAGPAGDPESRIFSSEDAGLVSELSRPQISSSKVLQVFGAGWTVSFRTRSKFDHEFRRGQSYAILVAGVAASVLLAALTFILLASRDQARRELEQLFREQRTILENAGVGIASVKDGKQVWTNGKLATLLGYEKKSDIEGKPTSLWFASPEENALFESGAHSILAEGGVYSCDVKLKRHDGTLFWGRLTGQAVDFSDIGQGSIWIVEDITSHRELSERLHQATWDRMVQIEKMATTDSLTGLSNRHKLHMILEREIGRAQRYERPFSILMLDIDQFKQVNDTYGHLVGDEVLKRLADSLRAQVRHIDDVVRWGGEEFLVILPETDLHGAVAIAERIREVISQTEMGVVGFITVSFGATEFVPGDTSDALVKRADDAMYRAKQGGRNRVEIVG